MIRLLTQDDFTIWKAIRLEALKEHPQAFSGSYEEESLRSDEEWKKRLKDSCVFAYFDNNKIAGVVGYYPHQVKKDAHRAEVYTTYLQSNSRNKGVMSALIQALAEHARKSGIEQLELDVTAHLSEAKKCYERNGFTVYGTKPRTLKIAGKYYDTLMMIKYL